MAGPELVETFMKAATDAAATVERIPHDAACLNQALQRATVGEGEVLLAVAGDVDPTAFIPFRADPRVITAPTQDQYRHVRTGVTDAFAGVASTGSICVGVTEASPVTMLTQAHIAVLSAASIVERPRDLFSSGKGLARSFSFITGPSATADMGPLVRGVHGPGTLHIIILG